MFWVYVLENPRGMLYVGQTGNIEDRLVDHNRNDSFDGHFTRKNRPWKLVWTEEHPSRISATRRERQINTAGKVEHLNRQVLEYFGKTNEELKNWAMGDAVHPDDLPRVIDMWRHAVENGEPYEFELRHRRADGVYRWFQSNALPARDSEGRYRPVHVVDGH